MNGIDGYRRIKAKLAAVGHACGRHRVASTDARSRSACSFAQALVAGFQQSSCSANCPEPFGSPVRL
ncbi:hypothetical protein [Ectopseudomonas khazarica]|uniref:hypothetical protein n=1 Tax=Ectopseudomonas khazarica TaxID=2502979 RepID=UPI0037C6EB30